jgi:hypothetical protein
VGRVPNSLHLYFQCYARTNNLLLTAFLAILIPTHVSFQSAFSLRCLMRFFLSLVIQMGLACATGALILVLDSEVAAASNTTMRPPCSICSIISLIMSLTQSLLRDVRCDGYLHCDCDCTRFEGLGVSEDRCSPLRVQRFQGRQRMVQPFP